MRKIDRNLIFREISGLYAFREIDLKEEQIDEGRLNFIRGILYNLDDAIRDALLAYKIVPFKSISFDISHQP